MKREILRSNCTQKVPGVIPGNAGSMEIRYNLEYPTNYVEGLDGKSAYDYALEGGYDGTEEEFYKLLSSLANSAEGLPIGIDIYVRGQELGQYKDGDFIPADTPVSRILRNIFYKSIKPKVTIDVDYGNQVPMEGTYISPTIIVRFIQGSGGPLESIKLTCNGELISEGNSDLVVIDQKRFVTETLNYQVVAKYSEGPNEYTDLEPIPEGYCTASKIIDSSDVLSLFYSFDLSEELIESKDVLTLMTQVAQSNEINIDIPTDSESILLAIPNGWDTRSILMPEVGIDIFSSFIEYSVAGLSEFKFYYFKSVVPLTEKYLTVKF